MIWWTPLLGFKDWAQEKICPKEYWLQDPLKRISQFQISNQWPPKDLAMTTQLKSNSCSSNIRPKVLITHLLLWPSVAPRLLLTKWYHLISKRKVQKLVTKLSSKLPFNSTQESSQYAKSLRTSLRIWGWWDAKALSTEERSRMHLTIRGRVKITSKPKFFLKLLKKTLRSGASLSAWN